MTKPSHPHSEQAPQAEQLYTLSPVKPSQEKSSPEANLPDWIRLPKSGSPCRYSGLSRSKLNQLILGPDAPVKSVSLRKQYALRGTRLIHRQSLLAYLDAEAELQRKPNNNNK